MTGVQTCALPICKRGKAASALQALRFADAAQQAHEPAQVMRCGGHEVPLADIDQPVEPTPPRPAGVADVRERPFDHLAPPPLEFLTLDPLHPPTVVHHRPPVGRRLVGQPLKDFEVDRKRAQR